jgi:prepilin-type N-terminal cleavage/methylation domain-containing protein
MKERAFTLIELLIVIAIIAVLAAIAVPVASSVMRQAKNTSAKTDISALETAIAGYRHEYGKFPLGAHGADVNNIAVTREFMRCLLGHHDGASFPAIPNPREINFLDPRLVDTPRNGYFSTDGGFYDPWGNCYVISVDGNYDGLLPDPDTGSNLRKDVLVYSLGPNAERASGNLTPGTIYNDPLQSTALRSWK